MLTGGCHESVPCKCYDHGFEDNNLELDQMGFVLFMIKFDWIQKISNGPLEISEVKRHVLAHHQ